jgi:DNA-binding response OmpR family regulator
MLPGLNGLGIVRQVRRREDMMPILFLMRGTRLIHL